MKVLLLIIVFVNGLQGNPQDYYDDYDYQTEQEEMMRPSCYSVDHGKEQYGFDGSKMDKVGITMKGEFAEFGYTHFESILKCAKELKEETLIPGLLDPSVEKCHFLDCLANCMIRWQRSRHVNCREEIKDFIQMNINVSN